MSLKDEENLSSTMSEFIKRYEVGKLHYDLLDRLMFVIAAGFALIAALAWDDVLHSLFSKFFTYIGEPLTRVAYAIILTILAAITAVIFKKISKKRRKKRMKLHSNY